MKTGLDNLGYLIEIKKYSKNNVILFIFLVLTLFFKNSYALFNTLPLFYNCDGLYCGWLAKELLDGNIGWKYIFDSPVFLPDAVVNSHIVSLSFSIFGDNLFSLVLVPIVFSVLILTVFYFLLKKYFSFYTAIVFSFLFIFSPYQLSCLSLYRLAYHFESIFFSVLELFCFFEIFFNENQYKAYLENIPNKKLNLLFITLGIISGFGIYFDYISIIMLFTIISVWVLIDKRIFLRKHFYIFLAGFIISLVPWLAYNTMRNFSGLLSIGEHSFSKIMFSKSLPQIFQTFIYIVTDRLPQYLGIKLYLTIIFSFGLIIFLNPISFKRLFSIKPEDLYKIKELIFIGYVSIFIIVCSIAYLPIGGENVLLWMSGLWGRLMHLFPFLFVLVALCFNRFLPFKKDKTYFLKIIISTIFAIWILSIGYLNYFAIFSSSLTKVNLLKIKGYSCRSAYRYNKKRISSLLDRDISAFYRRGNTMTDPIEHLDGSIYFHSLFSQKPLNVLQLDESRKLYYYLILGLNTGDLMEGYNILNLNKLTIQKVPIQYEHYFYEGVAISLMNRRRNEIMENIDFIEKIPMEYRHYFLLELGRVIGSYSNDKIRQEKLQYSIKRFSGIYESYIRRGLVENLANKNYLKNQYKYNIQKEEFPYLYRAIPRYLFGNLPLENDVFNMLKNFKIGKNNERYFYQGIVEAFFKDNSVYQEDIIKNKIETIVKCNWTNKDALYEGLGLSLGHLTFGYIKKFIKPIESSLDANQLSRFYYGYCISLKERYGMDSDMMKKLIDDNVTEESKEMCYIVILNKII